VSTALFPTGWLRRHPSHRARRPGAPDPEVAPLRAELFTTDQMEQHGRHLAAAHRLAEGRHAPDHLLDRLASNEEVLVDACTLLSQSQPLHRNITPAGEWLLDNFYLIEEEIRTARRHLPPGYSRELPRLQADPPAGLPPGRPRVYDLAQHTIAHGDGRVGRNTLMRFVAAYQGVKPLRLGELWAVPIMLRLALIENLRRLAVRVVLAWHERRLANTWADEMLEMAERNPKGLVLVIADMARSDPPMTSPFVAELARRLQGHGAALALPLSWIEQHLAESHQTIEQMVLLEGQTQAAAQVSVSNSIGSLRLLGAMDWREFVESLSLVEQALRQDPLEVYPRMDFATRDQYRHAVERIARRSPQSEEDIAHAAVRLAAQALEAVHKAGPPGRPAEPMADGRDGMPAAAPPDPHARRSPSPPPGAARLPAAGDSRTEARRTHVGHYLVGAGRAELEAAVRMRPSPLQRAGRAIARAALPVYAGAILMLTFVLAVAMPAGAGWLGGPPDGPAWALLRDAWPGGATGTAAAAAALALFAALLLLAGSHCAVGVVNRLATLCSTPRALPRLDYSQGLPAQARTLVVVPTLLGSPAGVADLLEDLEVRFLANRDPHLHFALLSDFHDAPQADHAGDAELLRLAAQGIEALNRKYAAGPDDPQRAQRFFLFHRPRSWNPRQGAWMGRERKRGKLADLNALLLRLRSHAATPPPGTPGAAFMSIVGDIAVLGGVRYVITLDTDTQLPRDAAWQLVGTLAHPLNRPHIASVRGQPRVVQGYGILQPRVSASLPAAQRSRYARLFAGEPGIDPYTRAVSDVYQDLFGEGSYIGKGIYDVDAFEHVLGGRLPDNRVLSHDLLEGAYARCGLVSDVELFEATPERYDADVRRRHRWVRGDWQLLAWLKPRVRRPQGPRTPVANPISALSRLKLLDNLRRSLVPPALTGLLLAGWLLWPPAGWWTLWVLALLFVPVLGSALLDLAARPREQRPGQHVKATLPAVGRQLGQTALGLACLPYEAAWSLHAVGVTLWRLFVTRRHLLEWQPAAAAAALAAARAAPGSGADLLLTLRRMAAGPLLAVAAFAALRAWQPQALPAAAPVLLLWGLSPGLVWWLSSPRVRRPAALNAQQLRALRRLARRTWAFFDAYVGAEDHALPPDNMQEHPVARVAHRTSPTNIGLALLARLAAYDFGHLTLTQLVERTAATLDSLQALPRYRGHFYNWYDTQTLQPLRPLYVSTVDSGNLAACLMTLRSGLLALADEPPGPTARQRLREGLRDTLGLLQAAAGAAGPAAFAPALRQFEDLLEDDSSSFEALLGVARELLAAAEAAAGSAPEAGADAMTEPGSGAVPGAAAGANAAAAAGSVARAPAGVVAGSPAHEATELIDADEGATRGQPAPRGPGAPDEAALTGQAEDPRVEALHWARALRAQCRAALEDAHWLETPTHPGAVPHLHGAALRELAARAGQLAQMDVEFLYDASRKLMTIGYNVDDHRRDAGYYDLLASEARLCSFVAIAQGRLPQESWFALGRLLSTVGGEPVLLSWSGSMFEYLMPDLLMPGYENTLLQQTAQAAVKRQIEYGRQRGVPWGISESGYHATDAALNYQYRAFGVPGLGLKRGLVEDLVVAPYATVLALMVQPRAAFQNLQRLAAEGLAGRYGFYEAIDYTPSRLPPAPLAGRAGGRPAGAVVRSYMAHHQGMALLALAHVLLGQPMQRRFAADPQVQASLLLLQERIPKAGAFHPHTADRAEPRLGAGSPEPPLRLIKTPDTPAPEVQLLSNGRYHVMLTQAGGGLSRWKDLAVTRWREDGTCDDWGSFCYLRDVGAPASALAAELAAGDDEDDHASSAVGAVWSATHQPTRVRGEGFEAIFSEGRAEFRRRDHEIDAYTVVVVSPEDDIELRRLRLTNLGRRRRWIEVTSYAELVLAPPMADAMHPAFNKLFVQTELLQDPPAVLASRRPRAAGDPAPWAFHLVAVHGAASGPASHETDRARFIGRGRDMAAPLALHERGALSQTSGAVLDPVAATRRVVMLEPQQTAVVDLVTGMADTREAAVALVRKHVDRRLADRVFELAWTHSQVVLRQLNAGEADTQLYARLAGAVVYAQPTLRADAGVILGNRRGQSALWGYAISGDLPIVLLQVGEARHIELVRQMVQAHAYWRLKGLVVDLVIWNEEQDVYRQRLHEQILGLVAAGLDANLLDRPGGVFVRHAEQIAGEDRILLQSVARAIISDRAGTLAAQVQRLAQRKPPPRAAPFAPTRPRGAGVPAPAAPPRELLLANGTGGFSADGREYIVAPPPGARPPAPWVNVLANPRFGSVVSEAGTAYTWCENAHGLRLTPWHNDPVGDAGGELLYLRDEDSGRLWSPTSLPAADDAGTPEPEPLPPYVSRHGFGYCVFEHQRAGIRSELTVFVALDEALKFSVLRLTNHDTRARRLSATLYVEWVLGDLRAKTAPHITTEVAPEHGALYARNRYSSDYGDWIGFVDIDEGDRGFASFTCDRAEFIGRNGTLRRPAALLRERLSGRTGAALDPCAAIQVPVELQPGQTRDIVFRLGMGRSADEAGKLVQRFRGHAAAADALAQVREHWRQVLEAVQVKTPDPALDLLANGWLVYQTMACRLWARSGFYQSGGAFGFRDQLQDAMALVHTRPQLLRDQLLLCASRQFTDGDVQHWWHPIAGRGVRTHISDDYLWLPLALCRYVQATGDLALLDEPAPFLDGRLLNPGDESYYDLPVRSSSTAPVYEHAVRAIRRMRLGAHGLPLMGGGDWNDGMNMVGHHGRGESVWLAFFAHEVLRCFAELARRRGDAAFAEQCERDAARLHEQVEAQAWDGQWYRRAYFDDGTPLGSAANAECRIDSIAQSWAVLSGVAAPERARLAMQALSQQLVRRDAGLVQLLDPPFNGAGPSPGYIAGYLPGVRENGGQYTHAAVWAAMAFGRLHEHEQAYELLAMINPLNHARTPAEVARYKVEPYVMAADVYSVAPHTGRGGWTWYTGSAGWMYRLIVESVLGLQCACTPQGELQLRLAPRPPAAWPGFVMDYRHGRSSYRVECGRRGAESDAMRLVLDGREQPGDAIALVDDGRTHHVRVEWGPGPRA
jgi:cyclic beta-1,2-glucan synthetase